MSKAKPTNHHKCPDCKFVAKSKGGLTTHMNAQHLKLSPSQNDQAAVSVGAVAKKRVAAVKAKASKKKKTKKRALKKDDKPKFRRGLEAAPKGGSGKRTFDATAAFKWYLEDVKRSYDDVAKEFKVTKKTVENNARVNYMDEDGSMVWCTWAERRQALGKIAREEAEKAYIKSSSVRSEKHLEQYRLLQEATTKRISTMLKEGEVMTDEDGNRMKIMLSSARDLADAAKALKLATDGERVIMGLATAVSTIKPGSDDDTGKGWGELLALALKEAPEHGIKT